jgi:phosphoenolpyruvate carboxykinase (GTP)
MPLSPEGLSNNARLLKWVEEMRELCGPSRIFWCDGSEREYEELLKQAVAERELITLNEKELPGCYLHRSAENDVARTEHLTFICTRSKDDSGPTNNWMDPRESYQKLTGIFRGSMKERTLYVVPFIMGPAGSPFSKIGIQLTDSIYVTLSMRVMTRMGKVALDQLGQSDNFTRCLHGKADLDVNRRFICHFPEDNTIWSVGSDYGGNALLGKKCLSLRIGSFLGRKEGWMAEHMLILGVEDPSGRVRYLTAAFPSQCGKTNLAMMLPPPALKGYKVWLVGDDIAWLRVGPDGRLWAVNPEAGIFGVAPGTSDETNPNAIATIRRNTIYTNVALKPDRTVWWEGLGPPPSEALDWRGKPWTPDSKEKAAHPNSRFAAPVSQCPSISSEWQKPQGVPISAILFGGRRAKLPPLIYESFNWQHGVFVGATMASETTAAATGQVGVVRRDPMSMLPFCGYHIGDYFNHWLDMGRRIARPPKIFYVDWFKTDQEGSFLWPGFGENLRVLLWALDRAEGKGDAVETPIGYVPARSGLNLEGLDLPPDKFDKLFEIDYSEWRKEEEDLNSFFEKIGPRLPESIRWEQKALLARLNGREKD